MHSCCSVPGCLFVDDTLMTRCEQLGVCQVTGCSRCLDKLLVLNPDKTCANISATGLDHQTLGNVDTTDPDKRTELSLNLLDHFGVATTGGVNQDSKLDKRECPHFCVPTRRSLELSTGLLWWFSYCLLSLKKIGFRFPHLGQRVQQIKHKGVLY